MKFLVTDDLVLDVVAQFNTRKEAHNYCKELRELFETKSFSCYECGLSIDITFKDMWEHYRVQYKDSNTKTEELYSIEALGFLKALRLLYPEHIKELNKEIATILSQLMIKVLGDD